MINYSLVVFRVSLYRNTRTLADILCLGTGAFLNTKQLENAFVFKK